MPGLVAGTLLTFIPAAGDYINAELLGNPRTRMIGNDIQDLFAAGDYPIGVRAVGDADGWRSCCMVARLRPPRRHRGAGVSRGRAPDWLGEHASCIFALLVLLYMFVPIFVVVLMSFNDPASRYSYTFDGFTLRQLDATSARPYQLCSSVRLSICRSGCSPPSARPCSAP